MAKYSHLLALCLVCAALAGVSGAEGDWGWALGWLALAVFFMPIRPWRW